jgi:histidyl-tRNA synthetase
MPVAVILGQDELEAGQVRVKRLQGDRNTEVKDKGQLVSGENLVEEVRKLLASTRLVQG